VLNIYKENKEISSSISSASQKYKSMFPFYLLLFYLFLEYGRPQHLLPFLTYLHLPALSLMLLAFIGVNTRKFKWKNKQTILFLFFLGLMVIHGPIAVNNYWTLKIFIAMVINLIAYLSLSNFTDKKENYNKLVDVWLAIHIFLAIIGIKNSGAGIGGFLGDENDFCMTVNMIIPFSFFLAVYSSYMFVYLRRPSFQIKGWIRRIMRHVFILLVENEKKDDHRFFCRIACRVCGCFCSNGLLG
jgi:hypothetical protein